MASLLAPPQALAYVAAYRAAKRDILKARRTFSASRSRSVDASAASLANAISSWLLRIARREARLARARILARGPRAAIRKEDPWARDELELLALLERYGLRQFSGAARAAADGVGSRWSLKPGVKDEFLARLEHKVALVVDSTRDQINESLRRILRDSLGEEPRPSTQEIARRIARQFHGPAEGRESVFSFERAALIARTELAQAENAGIAQGFTDSGVNSVEWLANTDGRSGDRHHERMNGKTISVAAMNGSDESKWFKTPLGNRMPYPGWSGAPVEEIANCRCTLVPS